MPINSCQKGKRGERLWRDELRAAGFTSARRGRQYSGSPESPDVVCTELPYHFEVKWVEALNVYKAMEQAIRDSGKEEKPVVAHKRNSTGFLVTMRAEDWLALVTQVYVKSPIPTVSCVPAERCAEAPGSDVPPAGHAPVDNGSPAPVCREGV